ncbi:MFS transporter [Oricola sp.]|uniref:MFS transporter n=1 Tax=Oricola sp. TaxID=1979950 RepID=UPI0025E1CEE3|nr:MFS transporter [Oricola sp.]MCI5078263.1 MFS transporter [Oricola sp.]
MNSRKLPASIRVLLEGQYGLFFAGNGLSLVGTWMQRIACSWLVWDWTGSAFWLGVLAAGDLLPVMVVGPVAGVAADRWDRLLQNRIAQAISACLAISLAVLLWLDWLTLFVLVVFVTLQGTVVAAVQPARLAMVQQMVPREDMRVAVGLNSVNVNLARLLGPAAAGLIILHLDIVWIFLLNAVVTFVFVLILGRLRLAPRDRMPERRPFLSLMGEGFGFVLRTPALLLILGVLLAGGIAVRSMLELVPAIAAETFSDTAAGLAILTGASAVGAVVSGLTVGSVPVGRQILSVLLYWGVGACAVLVLTNAPTSVVAVISSAVMGAAITRGLVGTQTYVQLTTPDALRGRTLSVHGLIARGSPALGALAIGYAADRVGLAAAVAVSSVVLVVLVGVLVLFPTVRRL